MRKMAISLLVLMTCGCGGSRIFGQVPPTTFNITYTWAAPAPTSTWTGCTAASPCSYVLSILTVTAGTTTCPVANGNYAPVNQSAPVSGTTYTYLQAQPNTLYCAVVQTEQAGVVSAPSAPSAVVVVPGVPAPGGPPAGTAGHS